MDPAAQRNVRQLPTPSPQGGYDRVPPHNLDAEVSVLGAMLLSKNAIAEVTEVVHAEDFYRGAHRTMFEAIHDLYDRGEPVDAVTLADELEKRGTLDDVGGGLAIADILAKVPTSANALHYGRIVAEHAIRRRLIETGTAITRIGYDTTEGVDEAVDSAEQMVYNVAQLGRVSEFTPMKQLITEGFALIERLHESNSAITGLATGFTDLDELTSGLQPSQLIILAARPAMGKCLRESELVLDPVTGARRTIGQLVAAGTAGATVHVAALSPEGVLRPVRVSAFHANGVRRVHRVRTRLGREIVATANHPLLTRGGWQPLEAVLPGQVIATPAALPFFGGREVPDAAVGVLADGLTRARSAATAVPPALFELPRAQLASFLRRLLEHDADVTSDALRLAVRGEVLARDLQHLLLRFGVVAGLRRPDEAGGWELLVEDPASMARLASEVGVRAPALVGAVPTVDGARSTPVLADPTMPDVVWDEVVAVEPAGVERVYDLTVPGDHCFVAGDVIVHNSTLVTNIATNVAVEQKKPAVLFSLEMSQMELVQRVLAAEARIDSGRLRTGRLQDSDWPKLSQAVGRLAEAPLFIDDTPGINMMEIRSKCRRLKQKHGLDLIIVDYLQLMQSHRRVENRVQEVSELSRGLKILAKELEVPVIALSQLSRRPEERTDRRPQLADLRESGSIEQDADIVAFIYRDEVYNQDTAAKGEAELIVAKHRAGPLSTIHLAFLGPTSRFANLRRGPGGGPGGPGIPPAPPPAGPL
jgi:replicative DNA helicase